MVRLGRALVLLAPTVLLATGDDAVPAGAGPIWFLTDLECRVPALSIIACRPRAVRTAGRVQIWEHDEMVTRHDRSLGLAPGSVRDYRELARRRLPRQLFDYIDGGANEEATMRANSEDLQTIRFRQRVLRDVSTRDLASTVLGETLALPLILAPVGMAGMFARRAEVQAARAATATGISFCESTLSICSVDEVAQSTSQSPWFQLYLMRDRAFAAELMQRAADAGVSTLVMTVDLAVVGARYRDVRNAMVGDVTRVAALRRGIDFASHPRWVCDVALRGKPLGFGNLEAKVPGASTPDAFKSWVDSQFDPSVTWEDLGWIRERWDGQLVVKGILDPDDARHAIDQGADGIVISNHGGRQLDDVASTISVLPTIAHTVNSRAAVLLDGGIRSGLDILKALALGADACMIGRPWAYAVAARGQAGVEHVISILSEEMMVGMGLLGITELSELTPDVLA